MPQSRICSRCDEEIGRILPAYLGDPDTEYAGKMLCYDCYNDAEPLATIEYRPYARGPSKGSHEITPTRNTTQGDFKTSWHPVDAWRGFYELHSKVYSEILSDAILSYHESEAMLKQLDTRAMAEFEERRIEYVRTFARTSNVFSTGYGIWVLREPEQMLIASLTLDKIKKEVDYHNPLYSTGILMDREELGKLQKILKGKYELKNDNDLMKLMNERGDELLDEIQKLYQESDTHGD